MDLETWLSTASVEDKCRLLAGRDFWSMHGIDALGVPSIVLTDGPHGVRLQETGSETLAIGANQPATCFPTASTLASTWDPVLVERIGRALALESRALGVSVLLGPGANIKRTPLCGRNFEYFSEDPLVSTEIAGAWIRGLQSEGVGASLKHFAANNQETLRFSVDSVVDERAMREIYLASFEGAIKQARPWTVMAAYNRVGGEYATESPFLLQQVLRDEWGFDGVVMSDWGAVNDRADALAAGLDLQMPGLPGAEQAPIDAVRDGRLASADVDEAIRRLVALVERTEGARVPVEIDVDAHHALAEEAAAAGSVLLANDGTLPLSPDLAVAVLGDFAATPRFQGAGSSVINARRVVDALSSIRSRAVATTYAQGYERYAERPDAALLDEARRLAAAADVAVVFVGLPETFETEGADRTHMRLPAAHDALVEVVAAANPRTVVVLSNGSPVEMPWLTRVAAVLEGYLGGQESGGAIAKVLYGEAEPGGRLAETFPVRWTDHPVHDLPLGPRYSEYRESIYVGYRWFDTVGADVAFPFGHGLSYTSFAWSDVEVAQPEVPAGDDVVVRVTVTNTGSRRGCDVVQVYLRPLSPSVHRPGHELAAFGKVELDPGESRIVELVLDARAFSFWSPAGAGWVAEPGDYDVEVGASSRDIRGTVRVTLTGDRVPAVGEARDVPPAYAVPERGQRFDRASFESLLGRELPPNEPDTKGSFTVNTPLQQLGAGPVMTRLRNAAAKQLGKAFGDDEVSQVMVRQSLNEGSLRMLSMFAQGKLDRSSIDAILLAANGQKAEAARGLFARFRR